VRLNHLHLHVASVAEAADFYQRWFGFARHVAHGQVLFLRDAAGMDLALAPGEPDVMPPWFHFGFRLDEASAVAALHARLAAEGVTITEPLTDEEGVVSFRCLDPDGHAIEVYWEAQPA
jgi:catechol 2,3-dioxygenase-like lactoylglutathione lyase family enzyme